jgi:osmotically inducible lipoprotein OsmB
MTGRLGIAAALAATLSLGACGIDRATGDRTLTGAAVGAASGAVVGLLSGNPITGAVRGAAGGAAGGLVYDQIRKAR